jgi:hypothetical protein
MNIDKRPVDDMCIDCKYYYDEDIPDTVGCGECRYGPPTAMPIFGQGVYHSSAFPLVSEYEWCWRFEKKPYYYADLIANWLMVEIITLTNRGEYPNGTNAIEHGRILQCKELMKRIMKDIKHMEPNKE